MARRPVEFEGFREVDGAVEDFVKVMDPQLWQDSVPALWTASRLVKHEELPPDRNVDPELDDVKDQIDDKLFFEVVVIPFLAKYRNVLKTTLKKTRSGNGKLTRIDFEYRQHECLTGVFLGKKSNGSIDVDRGGAVCKPGTKRNTVRIDISKTVRFTKPKKGLAFVDLFSRVAVKAVLELLLVGLDMEIGEQQRG